MQLVRPAADGLRTLYELGVDRLWFLLAVGAGLLLASWLGERLIESMIVPLDHGLPF